MTPKKHSSYMTDEIGPLPFCPGCGHGALIKSLDKALVKLQPDNRDVVIVTDIGCIGLSDRHFTTNAFHGLHGRSITYGCGLKLARPELTVIVIQGDGGCGIGGAHLLNVARRNIGITLIVANNFNYGMTGGQHSVTTPTAGITSTTPWGNVEDPMDLCGTVAAAGAPWVYRATAFDKDLDDAVIQAIQQPGFAMLDVWELCSAYYSPRNKLNKANLFALLDNYGFKRGLLADRPRPEYSAHYRAVYEKAKRTVENNPPIEQRYPHALTRQTGIVIAGSAGQKVRSAATLLAQSSMYSGLEATQKDDYPITVMTGHSISEVILSPERIDYTAIDIPDYIVVITEDGLKKVRNRIEKLPEGSTVIAEESLNLPGTKALVIRLPIIQTSHELGKLTATIIAVASLIQYSGMFPIEAFATAVSTFQKASIAETNIEALEVGAALVAGKGLRSTQP